MPVETEACEEVPSGWLGSVLAIKDCHRCTRPAWNYRAEEASGRTRRSIEARDRTGRAVVWDGDNECGRNVGSTLLGTPGGTGEIECSLGWDGTNKIERSLEVRGVGEARGEGISGQWESNVQSPNRKYVGYMRMGNPASTIRGFGNRFR